MKRDFFKILILLLSVLSLSYQLIAQSKDVIADTLLPNLFLDCEECDVSYFKDEISIVNFVIDRKVADIHLLITAANTGSSGQEFTLIFHGKEDFSNYSDTLTTLTTADITKEELREKLINSSKIGLLLILAQTPLINQIIVDVEITDVEQVVTDKWKNWVFRTQFGGNFNKEQRVEMLELNGSFRGRQLSDERILRFLYQFGYQKDKFEIDSEIITSSNNWHEVMGTSVWSLGEHWAVGGNAGWISSRFLNIKNQIFVGPAIEFNVFPYSEYVSHELRLNYSIGWDYSEYFQTTIYEKEHESLWSHAMVVNLNVVRQWGNIEALMEYENYLHDFSRNRLDFQTSLNLRLFKGFFLNLSGGIGFIHDQIALPLEDIAPEDILLRRRELETNFVVNIELGFEYTFGSLYSNIVNPRFGF